jgi:glucose-1-phosphate cytidylyltransferase
LALKAMLRAVGVDPPKHHDVGPLLLKQGEKFFPEVAAVLDRAAVISAWLRTHWELAEGPLRHGLGVYLAGRPLLSSTPMQVVILCGGLGTRLREETEFRPKPMIEVGGRPLLWHIMKIYAHYGHHEFVLCLGYKGDQIKQYFLNYETMTRDITVRLGPAPHVTLYGPAVEPWTVTLADTGQTAMTGTRVKRVERYVKDDTFMLTYGDGVADVNLESLVAFHRSHGRIATVTGMRPPSRFGELVTRGAQVVEFSEKPSVSQGYVSGGFFVFNRAIFDYLSDDDHCVLEREPLERLTKDGQLEMHAHDGYFQCMDTPRDLHHLNEAWSRPHPPWKVWADGR